MAWTYNANLNAGKDQVRYLVGDTDTSDQLIQDEEIVFALLDNPNVYSAAAVVCRALAARLTRELTLVGSAGSVELDAQEQAKKFMELATTYDSKAVQQGGAGVFAGGISKSDKKNRESDPDRVEPAFRVDLHRSSSSSNPRGDIIDSEP